MLFSIGCIGLTPYTLDWQINSDAMGLKYFSEWLAYIHLIASMSLPPSLPSSLPPFLPPSLPPFLPLSPPPPPSLPPSLPPAIPQLWRPDQDGRQSVSRGTPPRVVPDGPPLSDAAVPEPRGGGGGSGRPAQPRVGRPQGKRVGNVASG